MSAVATAPAVLHALAGSPAFDGCAGIDPFFCWVCAGKSARGMLADKWVAR